MSSAAAPTPKAASQATDAAQARAPVPPAELHEALAGRWIGARYQPVVRIADRAPVAFEVLARLEHPTRGTLTPDLFIPQMEEAGLGWELTQAVVERALGEFGADRLAALDVALAVNFPLDVLMRPDAAGWLRDACAAHGVPPAQITVELTESQPIGDLDLLRDAVFRLRGHGFRLAIDDVGPAIRDHRQLLNLEFSILKLDKDLVRGSAADAEVRDFLLRALDAAHAARMVVVAEGVEDAAVWDRMASLGVDEAQGFMIARPLAMAAVADWLAAWTSGRPHAGRALESRHCALTLITPQSAHNPVPTAVDVPRAAGLRNRWAAWRRSARGSRAC